MSDDEQPTQAKKNENEENNKHNKIGNYILGETIGEGAFGKVKKATHLLTNEKVAVKILNKQRMQELSGDVNKIQKEINILKKLRHKNIIQLYEIMESKANLFLIIEFCPKGELFDYIVKRKKLSEFTACKLFQHLIDGVDYLHSNNIVHRDLKPENILLDDKLNIKISDFGLSTTYNGLISTPCGTPSYAPPEMLKGEKYVGVKSDVWSCGIILYAMLCGYLPYSESKEEIILEKILSRDYKIPDFLSSRAKDLLIRMLEIKPENRFDLKQIKDHAWFKLTEPFLRPGIFIGVNQIPIDEVILNRVIELNANLKPTEKMNISKEEMRIRIRENKFESVTACYYLLLKKHITLGGSSISDLQSKAYLAFITNPSNLVDVTEMIYAELETKGDSKMSFSPQRYRESIQTKNTIPTSSTKATVTTDCSNKNSVNNVSESTGKHKTVSISIDEINKRSISKKQKAAIKMNQIEEDKSEIKDKDNISANKTNKTLETPANIRVTSKNDTIRNSGGSSSNKVVTDIKRNKTTQRKDTKNNTTGSSNNKTLNNEEIKGKTAVINIEVKNNIQKEDKNKMQTNLTSPRDKNKEKSSAKFSTKKTTDYKIPGSASINLPSMSNPTSQLQIITNKINKSKGEFNNKKSNIIDIISEELAMKKLASYLQKEPSVKNIKTTIDDINKSQINIKKQKNDSNKSLQRLSPADEKKHIKTESLQKASFVLEKSPKFDFLNTTTNKNNKFSKRTPSVTKKSKYSNRLNALQNEFKIYNEEQKSKQPIIQNNQNTEALVNILDNINRKYDDFILNNNENKDNLFRVLDQNKKIESKRRSMNVNKDDRSNSKYSNKNLTERNQSTNDKAKPSNRLESKESVHLLVKHRKKFNFGKNEMFKKIAQRKLSINSRNNNTTKKLFNDVSAIYQSEIDYDRSFDNTSVNSPSPLFKRRKMSSRKQSIRGSFINCSEINLNIENDEDDEVRETKGTPVIIGLKKPILKGNIDIYNAVNDKDQRKVVKKETLSKPNENKIIFNHKQTTVMKKEENKKITINNSIVKPVKSQVLSPKPKKDYNNNKDTNKLALKMNEDIIKLY